MNYFGKKSLSSVASVVLTIAWYLGWVAAALALVLGVVIVFHAEFGSPFAQCLATSSQTDIRQWESFQGLPAAVRVLILPYFGAVMALTLLAIKRSRELFAKLAKGIVFDRGNVLTIRVISKLVIALSILTLSAGTLLTGVILLIVCEILKAGAVLQEEQDLTV